MRIVTWTDPPHARRWHHVGVSGTEASVVVVSECSKTLARTRLQGRTSCWTRQARLWGEQDPRRAMRRG